MSKKPLTNAQPAKEPTPTEQASSVTAPLMDTKPGDPQLNAEQTSSPEPFQLIPDFKISGKAKTMAKTVGIDLSSIEEMAPRMNDWAASVEQRLNLLVTAIPELPMATIKLLREEAEKQRAAMTQQTFQPQAPQGTAGQPAKGGFDIGGIMEILKTTGIMGGGNPANEKMTRFFDVVVDKAIDNVVNPPKDPLASIGEIFLKEYATKSAAALALKP